MQGKSSDCLSLSPFNCKVSLIPPASQNLHGYTVTWFSNYHTLSFPIGQVKSGPFSHFFASPAPNPAGRISRSRDCMELVGLQPRLNLLLYNGLARIARVQEHPRHPRHPKLLFRTIHKSRRYVAPDNGGDADVREKLEQLLAKAPSPRQVGSVKIAKSYEASTGA